MKLKLFFLLQSVLMSTLYAADIKDLSDIMTTKYLKHFGSAIDWYHIKNDSIYRKKLMDAKFSIITPSYDFKFLSVQKTPGNYTFGNADSLVNFCEKNNLLIRGHTLAWCNDQTLPDWILDTTLDNAKVSKMLKDYVKTVALHFKGKLYCWDVVNEATYAKGLYMRVFGESFVDSAFTWVNSVDPQTKLFYNESYGNCMEDWQQKSLEKTYKTLQHLKENNIRVDGIGFEMHLDPSQPLNVEVISSYLKKFSDLNLEIHFTEVDAAIDTPITPVKLRQQAALYSQLAKLFLSNQSCKVFVVWGFSDKYSSSPVYHNFTKNSPCLLDTNYQAKPAVDSLIQTLKANIPKNIGSKADGACQLNVKHIEQNKLIINVSSKELHFSTPLIKTLDKNNKHFESQNRALFYQVNGRMATPYPLLKID